MASLILPRRFTQQPQGAVEVDWSHPLAIGLQSVFLAPVNNYQGVYTAATSSAGVGIATNGTSDFAHIPFNWVTGSGITAVALADINWRAATTRERLVNLRTNGGTGYCSGIQAIDLGSGRRIELSLLSDSAGNTRAETVTLSTQNQSGLHLFAGSSDNPASGHSIQIYIDGTVQGTTAQGSTGGIGSSPVGMDVARMQYAGVNYFGRHNFIGFAALWNRALSGAEHAELSANPWQIFKRQPQHLYFDVGGGGAVTGTLSATETGSDTASLSGAIRISGTLAATEAGADTAAFTGSALVTSTGTLAATEAGADTAALTGKVVVSGTLAATEDGSDTAALTGSILLQGYLAATEIGADIAAFSGFLPGAYPSLSAATITAITSTSATPRVTISWP